MHNHKFQATWTIDVEVTSESENLCRNDFVKAAQEAHSLQGGNSLALEFDILDKKTNRVNTIDLLTEEFPELHRKLFIDHVEAHCSAEIDGVFVRNLGCSDDYLIDIDDGDVNGLPKIRISMADIADEGSVKRMDDGVTWKVDQYMIKFFTLTPVSD